MFLKTSSAIGPEHMTFVIRDSIENSFRVLGLIKTDDAKELADFDRLAATAKTEQSNLLRVAADAPSLSTAVATIVLLNILYTWIQGDPFAGHGGWVEVIHLKWESEGPSDHEENHIFRGMSKALSAMGEIRGADAANAEALDDTAAAFAELAEYLESREKWPAAFGCAQSAIHFFQTQAEWRPTEAAAAVCLRLAKRLENPIFIAGELERSAHLLCQRAVENKERQKDAFDALETALRYLAVRPELFSEHGHLARDWVKHPNFRLLQPLALAARPQTEWRTAIPDLEPEQLKEFLLGLQPIWDVDVNTLATRLFTLLPWANEVENLRLEWDPIVPKTVATASWVTFGFSHPHTRRSIPHSESILKEARRDNLLLDIAHETTHVYSVLGTVGLAAWAMRSAFFELETRLWTGTVDPADQLLPQRWANTRQPAELQPSSGEDVGVVAARLAQVEQELEIERKIQLIERLWAPWFEGLAVFGEHAADPREDIERYSPVVSVVGNLFDTLTPNEAEEQKISTREAVARRWARAEALLGEAQAQEGPFRLAAYFGAQHPKYLAGYLAVRSVVATWRARLDQPLSGANAFAMLLHATRYSGTKLVPPSDLPLAEFHQQLVENQLRWLREISSVPKEDLDALNAAYAKVDDDSGYVWQNGRIESFDGNSPEAGRFYPRLLERVTETRLALTGARADLNRVQGASTECRAWMAATAGWLEERAPDAALIDEESLNVMLSGVSVLPIGQVQGPFWLNRMNRYFIYWIRTREEDAEHGKPSYNAASDPLDEATFQELEKRVLMGAPSRVKITRVAYLADPKHQLLEGTNYLAFQLDDWFWLRNAGGRFAASEVPNEVRFAVQQRLDPHPFQATQEVLLDPETHPAAARSRIWLAAGNWQFSHEGQEIDLAPWAHHAEKLANVIFQTKENDDILPMSRALFEFVFGNASLAERLSNGGLDFLHDDPQLELMDKLLQRFHETGRRPVMDADFSLFAEQLAAAGFPIFEETGQGWDVRRPAVIRNPAT